MIIILHIFDFFNFLKISQYPKDCDKTIGRGRIMLPEGQNEGNYSIVIVLWLFHTLSPMKSLVLIGSIAIFGALTKDLARY
jgi:hypothetical protein